MQKIDLGYALHQVRKHGGDNLSIQEIDQGKTADDAKQRVAAAFWEAGQLTMIRADFNARVMVRYAQLPQVAGGPEPSSTSVKLLDGGRGIALGEYTIAAAALLPPE